MKVTVTTNQRFAVTGDGRTWSPLAAYAREFWQSYLDVFDEVDVLARATLVPNPPPDWLPVCGGGVKVRLLPSSRGPLSLATTLLDLWTKMREGLIPGRAVILRVPSGVSVVGSMVLDRGYPYAVEVLGDPANNFAPGAYRHPLRSLVQKVMVSALKRQCRGACVASYVTDGYLQAHYPAAPGVTMHSCSDGNIDDLLVDSPWTEPRNGEGFELLYVGQLDNAIKGPDLALLALSRCLEGGLPVSLTMLGGGSGSRALQDLAQELGIAHRVHFPGHLASRDRLKARLAGADLFLLPSRADGTPRALLEAMAAGLPCLASAVGGIPELLANEDLAPVGDPNHLAQLICEVISNRSRMRTMASRNLRRATDFRQCRLSLLRNRFYREVKDRTLLYLRSLKPS